MNKSNIIELPVITRNNLNPNKLLKKALNQLQDVIIIGWDKEGELYFSSSNADEGDTLWLIEKAKKMLLDYEDDE